MRKANNNAKNSGNAQYRKSDRCGNNNAKSKGTSRFPRDNGSNDRTISRGADDTFRKPQDDTSVRFTNEPTYYYTNKEVTDGALRIPYNLFAGTQYKIGDSKFQPLNVLVYHTFPTPTHSWDTTSGNVALSRESGIDWAAQRLYTALSAVNGKTTNYTPATISILMLAMGEVISMYSFIRRAFGYAYTYSRRNWGVPFSLFQAMGIDWADFRANIADYLTQFNTIIADMNKIPILSNVTYFQKCADMYNYVYQDDESPMAQLELMVPDYTWLLIEDSAIREGSILQTVCTPCCKGHSPNYASTMQGWLDLLRTQIYNLMMSQTLNVVYSDIYNYVFKKGMQVDHLPPVLSDYHLDSIYNVEWKNTMHNARVLGKPVGSGGQNENTGKMVTTEVHSSENVFANYVTTNMNDVWENSDASGIHYNPLYEIEIPKVLTAPDVMPYVDVIDYDALSTIVFDTSSPELTLEQKIEYTRYTTPYTVQGCEAKTSVNGGFISLYTRCDAPTDHSIAKVEMLVPSGYTTADGATFNTAAFAPIITPDIFASASRLLSVDKAPLLPAFAYTYNTAVTPHVVTGWHFTSFFSDLECLTTLNPDTERRKEPR